MRARRNDTIVAFKSKKCVGAFAPSRHISPAIAGDVVIASATDDVFDFAKLISCAIDNQNLARQTGIQDHRDRVFVCVFRVVNRVASTATREAVAAFVFEAGLRNVKCSNESIGPQPSHENISVIIGAKDVVAGAADRSENMTDMICLATLDEHIGILATVLKQQIDAVTTA